MKLSDLPASTEPMTNGIEVIVHWACPKGSAYVFTDDKMLVNALDDDIAEIKMMGTALRSMGPDFFAPPRWPPALKVNFTDFVGPPTTKPGEST